MLKENWREESIWKQAQEVAKKLRWVESETEFSSNVREVLG